MLKNKLLPLGLAAAIASVCLDANAVPFTLDFEGAGNSAQLLNFYNGGTDSAGNSGVNYGIEFGNHSLAIIDKDAGGDGNFANEPTPDTIMFFLSGSSVLNYKPGFDTGFSFYYTTAQNASVSVWDGLNASGNKLGTINLFKNNIANNCQGDPQGGPNDPSGSFCHWDIGKLGFEGIAKSIDFGGTANQVGFDNITFGSVNPNQPTKPNPSVSVAEPSSLALLLLSCIGIGATNRQKRQIK